MVFYLARKCKIFGWEAIMPSATNVELESDMMPKIPLATCQDED